MHELSAARRLVRQAEAIAGEQGNCRVLAVTLSGSLLSVASADVLRQNFALAAEGTVVEGARVQLRIAEDAAVGALTLESIEIEED